MVSTGPAIRSSARDLLLSDRALLNGFRNGEPAALERVYYAYVDRVFNVVRHGFPLQGGTRVGGITEPDAQRDLIQDIFVKAYAERARLSYDGLRPYAPYLIRIAKNALVDHWRRRGAELAMVETALDPEEIEEAAHGDTSPVEDLHWRSLLEATQSSVAQMTEEMRRFIHHRFVEDLSQRDIAERMRITRRRVRTLEDRVLRDLRKHLSAQGFL